MMNKLTTSRFLSLECLPKPKLDFRPVMELDYFLSKLPRLALADNSYFFLKIKEQFYISRKVIGLVDENLLKPYEFIDLKMGEMNLVQQDISFLSTEGLIDLSNATNLAALDDSSCNDSFLLEWGLASQHETQFSTNSKLFVFSSSLVIS